MCNFNTLKRMSRILVLLVIWIACAHGATMLPQCTWACDNPSCDAQCLPRCAPLNCTVECDVGDPSECADPSCSTACDPLDGQDVVNNCPTCDATCHPASCPVSTHENCTVTCEPVDCSWFCVEPVNCPYPQCTLQCAAPSCEYAEMSGALRIATHITLHVIAVVGVVYLLLGTTE